MNFLVPPQKKGIMKHQLVTIICLFSVISEKSIGEFSLFINMYKYSKKTLQYSLTLYNTEQE